MAPNINWGNVVPDPAERDRIMGLATGVVNRNEGAGNTYAPGYSRDQALTDAAYSFFPTTSGRPTGTMGTGGLGTPTPTFTGTGNAPPPTPYGTFGGLDPATFEHSPDYQYLQDTMAKATQRGAAAKGTLLTGGFQKELQKNAAGLAAGDYANAFNRALQTYNTNRDTNAQNYGQLLNQFQGNLGQFGANTDASLGYGRLGLEQNAQNFNQGRQAWLDSLGLQQMQRGQDAAAFDAQRQQVNDDYARAVAASREANARTSAIPQPRRRVAAPLDYARRL